jgi:hypothetical protein
MIAADFAYIQRQFANLLAVEPAGFRRARPEFGFIPLKR